MAKYPVFLGTYSKGEGKGLFRGSFDDVTGKLSISDSVDIENPSYLQLNEDILYGVSETDSFQNKNGGSLFAVSLTDTKKMQLLSLNGTNGKAPCHLCVLKRFVFIANYSEGSLSIFDKDERGAVTPSWQSIYHHGNHENFGKKERSKQQSHVHFVDVTPDNMYLVVCDLGLDIVLLYPYLEDSGMSTNAKIIKCPTGSRPRHLVFSPCGEYLYVLTELGSTILVYKYNGGNVSFLQEISTLPDDFKGSSSAAAIHVSPDGKVATSNRGHDSIAIFSIKQNGCLERPYYLMTGKNPRDFRYTANGEWILSANQGDDSVTVYHVKSDNTFAELDNISLPQPVCILFGDDRK